MPPKKRAKTAKKVGPFVSDAYEAPGPAPKRAYRKVASRPDEGDDNLTWAQRGSCSSRNYSYSWTPARLLDLWLENPQVPPHTPSAVTAWFETQVCAPHDVSTLEANSLVDVNGDGVLVLVAAMAGGARSSFGSETVAGAQRPPGMLEDADAQPGSAVECVTHQMLINCGQNGHWMHPSCDQEELCAALDLIGLTGVYARAVQGHLDQGRADIASVIVRGAARGLSTAANLAGCSSGYGISEEGIDLPRATWESVLRAHASLRRLAEQVLQSALAAGSESLIEQPSGQLHPHYIEYLVNQLASAEADPDPHGFVRQARVPAAWRAELPASILSQDTVWALVAQAEAQADEAGTWQESTRQPGQQYAWQFADALRRGLSHMDRHTCVCTQCAACAYVRVCRKVREQSEEHQVAILLQCLFHVGYGILQGEECVALERHCQPELAALAEAEGADRQELAVHHLQKAAGLELADAQMQLAICYERGWGVATDYKLAGMWFTKAAKQGHKDAQYGAGNFCWDEGECQDVEMAAHWFRLAAGQGCDRAQFMIGQLYEMGTVVGYTANAEIAAEWYQKAASRDGREGEGTQASEMARRALVELGGGHAQNGKPRRCSPRLAARER
jgi:hypothetical protein